jgi:putative transposase
VRTQKPEHLKTFDYLGLHQYFLTFCSHERRKRFSDDERVGLVRTQIARAAEEQQFAVNAYCYMPNHVHLLVEGKADGSDCLTFIARAKQYSGFHYAATFGDRLWQRYGFEHTLRSDEAALGVARYIVENPVRAGLVDHPADYPYSGSDTYTLKQILEAVQMQREWWRRSERKGRSV